MDPRVKPAGDAPHLWRASTSNFAGAGDCCKGPGRLPADTQHFGTAQLAEPGFVAGPYLEVASGSIPLFLIASAERAEARNSISRLDASMSPEPATMAAEIVWMNWISGATLPAKSTPGACTISLTGMTARSAPPAATIPVASVPRGVTLTLIFSAIPSRGKRSVVSQIPLVLPGIATILALSRTCLKASTVLTTGFGVPARTARRAVPGQDPRLFRWRSRDWTRRCVFLDLPLCRTRASQCERVLAWQRA